MEKKEGVKKTEKFLLTDEEDKQLLEEYKKMIEEEGNKQVNNISRWGGWDLGDGGVSTGSDI